MREIKFRAWDSNRKEMLEIQRHSFKTNKSMPYGWNLQYEFEALMQYTGLNDKNGKEIYEGDIVKVEKYIGEVKFGRYTYSACEEYGCDRYGYYIDCETKGYVKSSGIDIGCCIYDCEVVGNIYENQELLKG